jgi:hypothetical protein
LLPTAYFIDVTFKETPSKLRSFVEHECVWPLRNERNSTRIDSRYRINPGFFSSRPMPMCVRQRATPVILGSTASASYLCAAGAWSQAGPGFDGDPFRHGIPRYRSPKRFTIP